MYAVCMIDRIGPYQISSELGRGGMGVVYLAHDTRLDRQVAIKVLPAELASDPARLERFEREAKTLASLSHPNLAGIFGVEEQGGAKYLVLEFVNGETLADVLDRGPLPLEDAIEYATQIAAGLEAAHEAGVIHRDLKPANVMITPDGKAKVLDFGLARTEEDGQSSTGGLDSPTMTTPQPQHSPTIEGAILGTAAYMSPEQARGRRVDKRTDIWSFGVVLYEMLTGVSPFIGETASDSIGAVLHKRFDLDHLPSDTPSNVRRVLERCLVRDKNNRYRDIGDVRVELLRHDSFEEQDRESVQGIRGKFIATVIITAAVVAAVAGVTGWFASRATLSKPERIVRKLTVHSTGADDEFDISSPQISPDGMKIAFIQDDAIMVRDLSTFGVQTLYQASGARKLSWSPDGRSIAYSTSDALFRIPATQGGAPSRLGNHSISFQHAWDDYDRILFSDENKIDQPGIFAIPARGGMPEMILDADPNEVIDFHAIDIIPDTNVVLYIRHRLNQRTPIEAWDGERTVLIAEFDDIYAATPAWSPTGHVLFARGFGQLDLWAVPFDASRMEVTGDSFLVMADASAPSVSDNGTLAFVSGSKGLAGELVWVLPDGTTEPIGDGGSIVTNPIVSPEGSHLVFAAGASPAELDIWVRDLERGINTRISSLNGFVIPTAWSPDQSEIAVMNFDPSKGVGAEAQRTVFLASDGTGETRQPHPGLIASIDTTWTRGVVVPDPRSGSTTASVVNLSDMSIISEITTGLGTFLFFSISPDGEYLLYASRESGKTQVYCTSFPSGEGRWQVSANGGDRPHWAPDGSRIYYISSDNELLSVDVTRDPTLRFGIPRPAFAVMPAIDTNSWGIRPAPDGKRFIAVGEPKDDVLESGETGFKLQLIENWYEEFRDEMSP